MKKNILISSMAAVILMTAASCKRDELSSGQDTQKYTFTCTIENEMPKVAISDAGKTTWEAGDQICVHGEYTSDQAIITLTANDISADGKTATISVEGVTPYVRSGYTSTLYAAYPASALKNDNHCYYYQKFNATNNILMAAWNEGTSFVFKNLCGIVSFSVNGDFDSYELAGNNGEAVGYESYQVKLTSSGQDYKHTLGTALTAVGGELIEGTNLVCLPNGANLTGGFSIKFFKGGECKKIAKSVAPVNVERGKLLPLGDVTSHLKDYVPPTIPADEPIFEGGTDLSAEECANCYIITAPGNYIFKAVKGNDKGAALESAQNAVVLWETYNNNEEVTGNSVVAKTAWHDGYIQVQMPSTLHAGNAVIAVKDGYGDIVWSWHIWVPATAITTNTYSLFNTELMDRNLGALVVATAGDEACDVTSYGLTYQWGRKDPFVGPKNATEESNATVAGKEMSVAGGQLSIAESIKTPASYGFCDGGNWSSESDTNLWTDDSKSIYDPCPAGYKVPGRDENQPLFSSDITTVTGWEVSANKYWITVGDPKTVFPVGGYRDDSTPTKVVKVAKRVAIWSAHCSSDAKAYQLNWRPDGGTYSLGESARSRGSYVRCVKTN